MKKIFSVAVYVYGLMIAAVVVSYFLVISELGKEMTRNSVLKQHRERIKFQKDSLQMEYYKQQLKSK